MKNLALIALACLALAGCAKNDSKGGGTSAENGFEGVWMSEYSSPTTSTYKNNVESVPSYFYLVVNANRELHMLLSGSRHDSYKESSFKIGKLKPTFSDTATIEITPDIIDEARRHGVNEEEITKALARSCTAKLKSADTLEVACQDDREGKPSVYKRTTSTALDQSRALARAGKATRDAHLPAVKSVLAGHKFRMVVRSTISYEDGKEKYKFDTKPEQIDDEKKYGESLHINVKTVEFSADLLSGKMNEKHAAEFSVDPLKDQSGVRLNMLYKTSETSWTYMASGKFEALPGGGFQLVEDTSSDKNRTVTKTVYELVR